MGDAQAPANTPRFTPLVLLCTRFLPASDAKDQSLHKIKLTCPVYLISGHSMLWTILTSELIAIETPGQVHLRRWVAYFAGYHCTPYRRGGRNTVSFSRRVRARVMVKAAPKSLASEPDLRQINPAVATGFITIGLRNRSPNGAKRNPGTNLRLVRRSRVSLRSTRATKKKRKRNAERRWFLKPPHLAVRLASCGTRSPSGVPPRLSPRGLSSPKARLRPCFLARGLSRALPAPPVPVQRAPRTPVIVPAG